MNQKLYFLQALRAIAAWLVVADHVLLELTGSDPQRALTHLAWTLGSIGVDTFFIISGFIMVHISWNEFGIPAAPRRFLVRRAARIVPLYWLGTLAALAYHQVSHTHGSHDGLPQVLQSLLFIPYESPDGSWNPILPQGWTLLYEAFFYLVFAIGLSWNLRSGLLLVGGLLAVFVSARPVLQIPALVYLADPIVLLFILGICLAVAWNYGGLREPAPLRRLAKWLEPFGNASYAIYLGQGLVLTLTARLWSIAFGELSIAILPVSLLAVTAAGLVIATFVEQPLLARILSRRPTAPLPARPQNGPESLGGLGPSPS